jgi:3-dehydrosphinganine reductase
MKITTFRDKRVFITGGSSGIGLTVAVLLASEGAHILIFGRDRKKLDGAVEKVRSSCASKEKFSEEQQIGGMQLDVADYREVEEVLTAAVEDFGVPDIFINSAGRSVPHYFEDVTYEQFDKTMKINLYGVRNTCAVIVPHMKNRGGILANVASLAGPFPLFGYTDYCASKAAVIAFSDTLRSEVKPHGIDVCILLPPDTDTPGYRAENSTKPPETKAVSAVSTVVQPELVAKKLLKGMKKRKLFIVPTFSDHLFYIVNRIWPGLVRAVLDKVVLKEQKKMRKT